MEFKVFSYDLNGEIPEITESVQEIPENPQIKRMDELSKSNPGKIVMGLSYEKEGQKKIESEQVLDD